MGNNLTYLDSPVKEKVSYNKDCGKYTYGVSSMQGWKPKQEVAFLLFIL